jgi:hypothetical protein
VIRLGLRLAVAGGREAVLRLVVIAAAVALGVGMLLGILAAVNAVQLQGDRFAILNTSASTPGRPGADPLWWVARQDMYDMRVIDRIDVAATGPSTSPPTGRTRRCRRGSGAYPRRGSTSSRRRSATCWPPCHPTSSATGTRATEWERSDARRCPARPI